MLLIYRLFNCDLRTPKVNDYNKQKHRHEPRDTNSNKRVPTGDCRTAECADHKDIEYSTTLCNNHGEHTHNPRVTAT